MSKPKNVALNELAPVEVREEVAGAVTGGYVFQDLLVSSFQTSGERSSLKPIRRVTPIND